MAPRRTRRRPRPPLPLRRWWSRVGQALGAVTKELAHRIASLRTSHGLYVRFECLIFLAVTRSALACASARARATAAAVAACTAPLASA